MSVLGRKKDDWEYITLCDFGDYLRRHIVRHHFSLQAALNAYEDLKKIYGQNSERCWQEDREGNIINDNHNESPNLPIVSKG